MNGHYLTPNRSYNIVPTIGAQQSSVYRTQTILNFDYSSKKGFVTHRDVKEAKKCIKRLNILQKRLDTEYETVTKKFGEEASVLMTEKFWEKYLDINI